MSDPRLVGNGTHLYTRDSHLVRTPIEVTLNLAPTEMAHYSVAGKYKDDWPAGGVIATSGQNIYYNQIRSGKTMRKYYLGLATPPGTQMWRAAVNQEPEFIFYQGSYSTTNGSPLYPEAYMQIPAYKFEIPETYATFALQSAVLKVTHGGEVLQHYSVQDVVSLTSQYVPVFCSQCANTDLIPAVSDWREDWWMTLGLYSALDNHPSEMTPLSSQRVAFNTSAAIGSLNGGAALNGRMVWRASEADGFIPVTDSPWVQSITLDAAMINAFAQQGGGWFVPVPRVGVSDAVQTDDNNSDFPAWRSSSNSPGWWVSSSFWGFTLQVTLAIL